jgi:hypothetical protein
MTGLLRRTPESNSPTCGSSTAAPHAGVLEGASALLMFPAALSALLLTLLLTLLAFLLALLLLFLPTLLALLLAFLFLLLAFLFAFFSTHAISSLRLVLGGFARLLYPAGTKRNPSPHQASVGRGPPGPRPLFCLFCSGYALIRAGLRFPSGEAN